MTAFHFLIRHRGNHYGWCIRSRKCSPFRNNWFHLWFSQRSCHLCLFHFMYSSCLLS